MNLSLPNELVNFVYKTMYFVRCYRSDRESVEKAEEVIERIQKAWQQEGRRLEAERIKRRLKKDGYTKREIKSFMKEFYNYGKED